MGKVMGTSKSILLTFLVSLALAVQIQAQVQLGFISIDCGLPANSSYSENTTSINYISDATFVDSGVSEAVPAELKSAYQQQLWSLRSFPEGIRNCYKINVTSGSKHLIRASFLYGNYDGLNELPQFDLHLGANLWDTVKITNASLAIYSELIHVPPLDRILICLANTGSGTPFISAIELRPLKSDTYETESGSLLLYSRLNLGSTSNNLYRYSYDVYDRFWHPSDTSINDRDLTQISASISANSWVQNDYEMPFTVMSTAATPVNANAPLSLLWNRPQMADHFYAFLHFAELQALQNNETREFNINLNGEPWDSDYVPEYATIYNIHSGSAESGENIEFSFEKTQKSTLPPIINAIEIYTVKEFSQSETDQEDVDAMTTIKSSYGVTKNWQGDPCSPVIYLWNGVNCTYDGHKSPRITALNLSSSGLTGNIDPSFSKLTMLEELDLSKNSLNGLVPDFLSAFPFLKVLNLENNNLSGLIPSELLLKSKTGALSLSWSQNPHLCESLPCNTSNNKKKNVAVSVVASVGGVLIFLIAMVAIFRTIKKRRPKAAAETSVEVVDAPDETSVEYNKQNDSLLQSKRRKYSLSEILKITNNFDKILGRGGFGAVYLGSIDDTPVAVKMLSASSVQGLQQFQAEVKLLLRVHHRNLTSLFGYCNEENNKGLIYEYMANGNLQEHLLGKDSRAKLLTWEDRLRIAVDAAQGLEYLHNGCKPPIIHRDVKSTNILLNESFHAKLSDFGLSKIIPIEGDTHVSTVVAGSPGYLDPDYYTSNRLTEKSDVFSFGVVLLEIITSRAAITMNVEHPHIVQWVSSMVDNGDIKNIVGTKMYGDYDSNSVWKALEIAMACVSTNTSRRPTMSEVVMELKHCLKTELARKHGGVDSVELLSMNITTEFAPGAR